MAYRWIWAALATWTATGALASAAEGHKLVHLITGLYGSHGLVVDSEARLPSGETHSAHFNSAFQSAFGPFNVALGSQLSSVPLPSPASGFTYTFDPSLGETGVFRRSTQSFGPILADRAETVGRGRLATGITFQRFSFDRLDGVDLARVPSVFTHDNPTPGGRADVVSTTNSIEANVDQWTLFVTYGIGDRTDVSLAVPVVTARLEVVSDAEVVRIGTTDPRVHFFRGDDGSHGSRRRFTAAGTATGVGDILLRVKRNIARGRSRGLAVGLDVQLPTGDELDFLGSGAMGVEPFAALSLSRGRFAPHLNLSYRRNGDSVLAGDAMTGHKAGMPDSWAYAAGIDVGVSSRLTLVLDLLGRRVAASPRLVRATFHALDGRTSLPSVRFERGTLHQTDAALGLKANLGGSLLLDLNLSLSLGGGGLRDRVSTLLGIEYGF